MNIEAFDKIVIECRSKFLVDNDKLGNSGMNLHDIAKRLLNNAKHLLAVVKVIEYGGVSDIQSNLREIANTSIFGVMFHRQCVTHESMLIHFDEIVSECKSLGIAKNRDYSRYLDNISITGLFGVTVRLIDKSIRIYNLSKIEGSEAAVKSESIEDTLKDAFNYAVYGIMLSQGEW